jgi:hypothetical protein
MKFYLTALFVLVGSFVCRSQEPDLIGVFMDVDISNHTITYIEFKANSSAILKKTNFRKNDATENAFVVNGRWKMNNDTVTLDFGKVLPDCNLYYSNESKIKLLVKDNDSLYSRRHKNGEFVKDGLLKRANKIVRLRPEFLSEYNDLPD